MAHLDSRHSGQVLRNALHRAPEGSELLGSQTTGSVSAAFLHMAWIAGCIPRFRGRLQEPRCQPPGGQTCLSEPVSGLRDAAEAIVMPTDRKQTARAVRDGEKLCRSRGGPVWVSSQEVVLETRAQPERILCLPSLRSAHGRVDVLNRLTTSFPRRDAEPLSVGTAEVGLIVEAPRISDVAQRPPPTRAIC